MFYPLLRTLPTLTGNFSLSCILNKWERKTTNDYVAIVKTATLMPLQNSVYNRMINVNLLNDNYEYDVNRYYRHYSSIFYDDNYSFNDTYLEKLDLFSNDINQENKDRNINYEMGCKRIPVGANDYQFCFFAPFYIDDVNDIPDSFIININFGHNTFHIKKKITIPISLSDKESPLYIYLKRYVEQIDTRCIFCKYDTKQASVYGISVKNGGFTIATDNIIGNIFTNYMRVNEVDKTITECFKRTKTIIKQVIPLSFIFNPTDLLTQNEKRSLLNTKFHVSGHYEKNGMRCDFADFSTNYKNILIDNVNILSNNNLTTIIDEKNELRKKDNKKPLSIKNNQQLQQELGKNYVKFIRHIDNVSLNESKDPELQNENTLSKEYTRWVLFTDDIKNNYVTNSSMIYNNVNNMYGDFPIEYFTNNSQLYICDDGTINMNNSYNDLLYTNNEKYFYETVRDPEEIMYSDGWENVHNNKIYYHGILYDFNNIIKNITIKNINDDTRLSYINIYDDANDQSYHQAYTYSPKNINKFGVFFKLNILDTTSAYLTKRSISYLDRYSLSYNSLFHNLNNGRQKIYLNQYSTRNLFVPRTPENVKKYSDRANEYWKRYDNREKNSTVIAEGNYLSRNLYFRTTNPDSYTMFYDEHILSNTYVNKLIYLPHDNDKTSFIDMIQDRIYVKPNNSTIKYPLSYALSENINLTNSSLYVKNYFKYVYRFSDEYDSYKGQQEYQYEPKIDDIYDAMTKTSPLEEKQLYVDAWNIYKYINNIRNNKFTLSDEYRKNRKLHNDIISINHTPGTYAYINYVDSVEFDVYRKRLYGEDNVYRKNTYLSYSYIGNSVYNKNSTYNIIDFDIIDKFYKVQVPNSHNVKDYYHYSYVLPLTDAIYSLMTMNEHLDFMIYGRDITNSFLGDKIDLIDKSKIRKDEYFIPHLSTYSYVLYPLNPHYLLEQTSHDKIDNLIASYNIHKINNNLYVWDEYEIDTMILTDNINRYIVDEIKSDPPIKKEKVIYGNDDNKYVYMYTTLHDYTYVANYDIYDESTYIKEVINSEIAYSYNSILTNIPGKNCIYTYITYYDNTYINTYTYYPSYIRLNPVDVIPQYTNYNNLPDDDEEITDDSTLNSVLNKKYFNVFSTEGIQTPYVTVKDDYYSYAYNPSVILYRGNDKSYYYAYTYLYKNNNDDIINNYYVTNTSTYNEYNININWTLYDKLKSSNIILTNDITYNSFVPVNTNEDIITYLISKEEKETLTNRKDYIITYSTYITYNVEYSSYTYIPTYIDMPMVYIGLPKNASEDKWNEAVALSGVDKSLFTYLVIDNNEYNISYVKSKMTIDEGIYAYYYININVYPNDISFYTTNNTEIDVNSIKSYTLSNLVSYIKYNIFTDCFNNIANETIVKPISVSLNDNIIYSDAFNRLVNKYNTKVNLIRYYNDIRPLLTKVNVLDEVTMLKYKLFNQTFKSTNISYTHNDVSIYKYPLLPVIEKNNNHTLFIKPYEFKFFNDNYMYNLEPKIIISADKTYTYDELLELEKEENVFNNVFIPYMKQYIKSSDNNEYLFLFKKYNVNFVSTPIKLNINKTYKTYRLKYEFNLI